MVDEEKISGVVLVMINFQPKSIVVVGVQERIARDQPKDLSYVCDAFDEDDAYADN